MNAPTRITLFAVGLAALFVAALVVGRGVGPDLAPAAATEQGHDEAHAESGVDKPNHGGHEEPGKEEKEPGGLLSTQGGYEFRLLDDTVERGRRTVQFVIDGPDGEPVTEYDVEHEKELHLIAVRRDATRFQHVHPTRAADGTWSVQLDLVPGSWRLFADFNPVGAGALTLGRDLRVPGEEVVTEALHDRRESDVGDYRVTLAGDLTAGEHAMLTLRVTKDGRPVTDLQPYLGAYGHLVALRDGDLAYLHVHPEEGEAGPEIEFGTEVPSQGTYHLYLDFKHGGVVRTATFQLGATP